MITVLTDAPFVVCDTQFCTSAEHITAFSTVQLVIEELIVNSMSMVPVVFAGRLILEKVIVFAHPL
jgi:hypothetical protein